MCKSAMNDAIIWPSFGLMYKLLMQWIAIPTFSSI